MQAPNWSEDAARIASADPPDEASAIATPSQTDQLAPGIAPPLPGAEEPEVDVLLDAPPEQPLAAEPIVLANATRLVDPQRLNDLFPSEILPRHLRRARRAVARTRGGYNALQVTAERLLQGARQAAVQGQKVARTNPGRGRAIYVQRALRRALELHALYDALQEERGRYARRTAAARDLHAGWASAHPGLHGRGRLAAQRLRRAILFAERHERITRERLAETRSALQHLDAAEEAMRRNSEEIRLDPITFTRFAGRVRWSVRLGILVLLLALLAAIYPPWAPPHLALTCADGLAPCGQLHAGAGLRLVNQGNGVLFGWVQVTVHTGQSQTSQFIPLIILPRADRRLTCADTNTCGLNLGQHATVTITTTGGGASATIDP